MATGALGGLGPRLSQPFSVTTRLSRCTTCSSNPTCNFCWMSKTIPFCSSVSPPFTILGHSSPLSPNPLPSLPSKYLPASKPCLLTLQCRTSQTSPVVFPGFAKLRTSSAALDKAAWACRVFGSGVFGTREKFWDWVVQQESSLEEASTNSKSLPSSSPAPSKPSKTPGYPSLPLWAITYSTESTPCFTSSSIIPYLTACSVNCFLSPLAILASLSCSPLKAPLCAQAACFSFSISRSDFTIRCSMTILEQSRMCNSSGPFLISSPFISKLSLRQSSTGMFSLWPEPRGTPMYPNFLSSSWKVLRTREVPVAEGSGVAKGWILSLSNQDPFRNKSCASSGTIAIGEGPSLGTTRYRGCVLDFFQNSLLTPVKYPTSSSAVSSIASKPSLNIRA